MPRPTNNASIEPVEDAIQIVRGQRVILDADLARIYGVQTKALNQAIRRNAHRFPADFAFKLTLGEWNALQTQVVAAEATNPKRSQSVTGSQRHRDLRFRPLAFTEHGALMAANVLTSDRAVEMSVFVVRAFIQMRSALAAHDDLSRKLQAVERNLTARLDKHENVLKYVLTELRKLMSPPEPSRNEIGFQIRESGRRYRIRTKR